MQPKWFRRLDVAAGHAVWVANAAPRGLQLGRSRNHPQAPTLLAPPPRDRAPRAPAPAALDRERRAPLEHVAL